MALMYIFLAVLGISLLAWDLSAKNQYKLIFAGAFLFTSIVAFKMPENYTVQAISFPIFTIILYVLIKTIFKKEQQELKKISNLQEYKDKVAIVKKDIGKTISLDGVGLIKFDNEIWQAKSIDDKEIKAGNKVKIISRENMIMNVEVIK